MEYMEDSKDLQKRMNNGYIMATMNDPIVSVIKSLVTMWWTHVYIKVAERALGSYLGINLSSRWITSISQVSALAMLDTIRDVQGFENPYGLRVGYVQVRVWVSICHAPAHQGK